MRAQPQGIDRADPLACPCARVTARGRPPKQLFGSCDAQSKVCLIGMLAAGAVAAARQSAVLTAVIGLS